MTWKHWLWTGIGLLLLIEGVTFAVFTVWPWARWTEDFFPGSPPNLRLEPQAWEVSDDRLRFAVVGTWDNDQGKGFDHAYPPETGVDLDAPITIEFSRPRSRTEGGQGLPRIVGHAVKRE